MKHPDTGLHEISNYVVDSNKDLTHEMAVIIICHALTEGYLSGQDFTIFIAGSEYMASVYYRDHFIQQYGSVTTYNATELLPLSLSLDGSFKDS